VKIAYWDTEQPGATPGLIGQVQGTPTIKLIRPKTKKNKKNKKKVVLDYSGERKVGAMKTYVLDQLANHVEKIDGAKGLDKFNGLAAKYDLPRILVFSKNAASPLLKYMSTEYRRRLLMGLVKGTKTNSAILKQYGVKDLPAVVAIPPGDGAEPVVYAKKDKKGKIDITFGKLTFFLDRHALKEAASAPAGDGAESGGDKKQEKPAKKEPKKDKKQKKQKKQKKGAAKDEL